MRRQLTLLQLFLINSVVCGLEFCASTAFTYVPPLLLKSGLEERQMSIILGFGPLLGLVFVPIIGNLSDHCQSPFGRRRPFILLLGCILLMSLVLLAFTDFLIGFINIFFFGLSDMITLKIWLLIIAAVLLDFTSQVCLTPCEALLSDILVAHDTPEERGFMVYSIMVSLGGCIGYLIAAVNWTDLLWFNIGKQENFVFSLLVLLFSMCLVTTVYIVHEIPHFATEQKSTSLKIKEKSVKMFTYSLSSIFNSSNFQFFILNRFILTLPESTTLRRLAIAHFFSWSAIMAFNLFYTDFVGQAIYGGNPSAPEDSNERALYDEGIRMGSCGLLLHCITAALYAFFIEKLVLTFGGKTTYFIGLMSFVLSMFAMLLIHNVLIALLAAACTGFAYATLTTIPYTLLNMYHANKHVFFADIGISNSKGIGTDLATLDSSYFLSQVMLSILMGNLVHLTGSVLSYILCAGILAVLSLLFITRLITNQSDMERLHLSNNYIHEII